MAFIQLMLFRAKLPQAAVMDFLAKTPPDAYCLLPDAKHWYYGGVASDDVVEYMLNEFKVISFQVLEPDLVKSAANIPGCRVWGNAKLILL